MPRDAFHDLRARGRRGTATRVYDTKPEERSLAPRRGLGRGHHRGGSRRSVASRTGHSLARAEVGSLGESIPSGSGRSTFGLGGIGANSRLQGGGMPYLFAEGRSGLARRETAELIDGQPTGLKDLRDPD